MRLKDKIANEDRREFLIAGGHTILGAFAAAAARPTAVFARDRTIPSGELEQRVADVVAAYDAQGHHRTGTATDNASAHWLAGQVGQMGVEAELEPFDFGRVDPQSAYLRIADRQIEGVPLFDAAFTNNEGVTGKLGPLGSDAEIGLAETEPFSLVEPRRAQAGSVAQARRSAHRAVVLLTRGTRPDLFLLNATSFTKPTGPPALQISSAESEWLKAQSARGATATLVAHVMRTSAQAFNVIAKIAGRNSTLPPVVLMAPRSGWWHCASEQGSRIACWLEALRVLAASRPARDVLFVALSGHELGLLGIDAYLKRRTDLVKRAHAWIFFGSDIGAPRQPNLVHASDDGLEAWIVGALEREGIAVNAKAPHGTPARGEAGPVQRGGGRFVTVACDSEAFHSVSDRWPEAIDVMTLARYARALANAAVDLAQHQG